jgi:hypothetical protein
MINVTTRKPARTTGSHHMHLTLQNAVIAVHAELFDMH